MKRKNNDLTFFWKINELRWLRFLFIIPSVIFLFSLTFYLFQIYYPPTTRFIPKPYMINLLTRNNENNKIYKKLDQIYSNISSTLSPIEFTKKEKKILQNIENNLQNYKPNLINYPENYDNVFYKSDNIIQNSLFENFKPLRNIENKGKSFKITKLKNSDLKHTFKNFKIVDYPNLNTEQIDKLEKIKFSAWLSVDNNGYPRNIIIENGGNDEFNKKLFSTIIKNLRFKKIDNIKQKSNSTNWGKIYYSFD